MMRNRWIKLGRNFLSVLLLGCFTACSTPQSAPQSAPCPTPAAWAAPPDYSFAVPAGQCAVCGTCPQLAQTLETPPTAGRASVLVCLCPPRYGAAG